jgi:hypothetical protein
MVIAIHFNSNEEVNRYEMIVGIGTIGFGILASPKAPEESYGFDPRNALKVKQTTIERVLLNLTAALS